MDIKNKLKELKNKKDILLIAFAVLAAAAIGVYAFYFRSPVLGANDAKAKAEKFINENLISPGTTVEIKSVSEESGLYKLDLNVGGQDVVSYLTKDGKLFFPQALDVADIEKQSAAAKQAAPSVSAAPVVSQKQDKPNVELFVMSYCPYGTQIEKGILPVLTALGSKINFTLKFVSYAMHDKQEIDENTRQYCIQKEQTDKFRGYLSCFLKVGDSAGCLVSSGVNSAKLTSCFETADSQFGITKNFNDKSAWVGQYPPFNINKADNEKYGVQGSPTLVINGQTIPVQRDSASLLGAICSGFANPPAECSAQLSSAQPAPGFGEGTAAAGSATADCGQ